MPRFKSYLPFYENNWLVPLFPGSKYPIYAPKPELPDPKGLHHDFKTEADYLLRKPTNDFVINMWKGFGYNVGVLTGFQRDGRLMFVQDFDLEKKFGSVEGARAWRKAHIPEIRDLGTRATFTPSGGLQVWNYATDQQTIDAVEPSVLADGRVYFFLDAGRPPIRELMPIEKPAIKADGFMGAFLDMFDSKRGGIQS